MNFPLKCFDCERASLNRESPWIPEHRMGAAKLYCLQPALVWSDLKWVVPAACPGRLVYPIETGKGRFPTSFGCLYQEVG